MRTHRCVIVLVGIALCLPGLLPAAQYSQELELLEGEGFWGGCVTDGRAMPFGREAFTRDLYGDTRGNQAQPLLISDQGRYVWSEEPFAFSFSGRTLKVTSEHGPIQVGRSGNTLREAFAYVSRTFFPSNGRIPDELLFVRPQYDTWIELIYDQREDRIRRYARDILDHGFPTGVLMIDDNWQEDYGVWNFHPGRFSDPKGMIRSLHEQGFKVMLWICPYFSPDSETFRLLNRKAYFYDDPNKPLDQELIVRSAQCSALMPMMQFSVAPWRVLNAQNMAICRQMAQLHVKLGPEILALARASAQTGAPIIRPLEYAYPHRGYAGIKDQFLLGDDILVAPLLEKGARARHRLSQVRTESQTTIRSKAEASIGWHRQGRPPALTMVRRTGNPPSSSSEDSACRCHPEKAGFSHTLVAVERVID